MGGIFSSEPESKRHEVLLLKEAVQTFKIGKSQPYPIINCLYDGTKDRQKLCEIESNKKDGHQICLSEFLDDFTPQDFSNNVILLLLGGPQSSSEISVKTDFSERFVKKLRGALVEPRFSIHGNLYSNPDNPFSFSITEIHLMSETPNNGTISEGLTQLESLFNNTRNVSRNREVKIVYSLKLTWKRFGVDSDEAPLSVLNKLFKEKLLADCVLVASNKKEVSCHRSIIAAHSDVLHAMLTSGLQESQTNRIEMGDVSEEAVEALVALFYQNEVDTVTIPDISEELALELLQTIHKYNISTLDALFLDYICSKPDDWFSTRIVLHFYLLTSKIDAYDVLRMKMIGILKRNATQLRSSEAYQEFLDKNPREAMDLAFILVEKLASK